MKEAENYQAFMSNFSINMVHLRSPWIVAWWSAAFPGFGHLLLGNYVIGFFLMIWELLVNNLSHLNTAITLSLIGDFEKAKAILSIEWMWLYVTVYVFTIWDSYQKTIQYNQHYSLVQKGTIKVSTDSALTLNLLEKRKPIMSIIWSLFTPGLGNFYLNRIPATIIGIVLWVSVGYYSNLFEGLYYTMTGNFKEVTKVLDAQWILFVPSIYIFSVYDAYIHCIEYNKLFDQAQKNKLMESYHCPTFKMPLKRV
ncbi:hypothetical protein LC087_02765 [Bacillus carboniphilus]|uniref:Uncharacterized protein n=1 Tax=Bacillus carboniphilus TaxID=86663 RepID=A0ABY9JUR3_9BACI|nr:hypothetical protein [Bacillus carboniphilus]WLR43146.1 hypothetical protein LC087_02765 [Bacillus carboniphilus]